MIKIWNQLFIRNALYDRNACFLQPRTVMNTFGLCLLFFVALVSVPFCNAACSIVDFTFEESVVDVQYAAGTLRLNTTINCDGGCGSVKAEVSVQTLSGTSLF